MLRQILWNFVKKTHMKFLLFSPFRLWHKVKATDKKSFLCCAGVSLWLWRDLLLAGFSKLDWRTVVVFTILSKSPSEDSRTVYIYTYIHIYIYIYVSPTCSCLALVIIEEWCIFSKPHFFSLVQTVHVSQMAPLVLSLPRLWRSSWGYPQDIKDICRFSLILYLCIEQPWGDSTSTTKSILWVTQGYITSFRSICILPILSLPQSQEYQQVIGVCVCFVPGGELNFPRVQQQFALTNATLDLTPYWDCKSWGVGLFSWRLLQYLKICCK